MLEKCSGKNKFSLTHEQMAQFLGVHRPGISNLAKELRRNGTIDYRRGQIIILDYAQLARLTCSCFHTT
jgi:CRP-like cAMP-binding protein